MEVRKRDPGPAEGLLVDLALLDAAGDQGLVEQGEATPLGALEATRIVASEALETRPGDRQAS